MHLHFKPKKEFQKIFFHCRTKPCVVSPTEQGVGGSQDKPGKQGKWERRRGWCRSATVGSWKNPPFLTYMGFWQQSVTIFLNLVCPGPKPVFMLLGSMHFPLVLVFARVCMQLFTQLWNLEIFFTPLEKKSGGGKKMWGTGSPAAFQEKEERELNQVLHKDRKRPANASWFNFFNQKRKVLSLLIIHGKLAEKREEGNLKGEQESRSPPTNHKMAVSHENRKTFPNRKHIKQSRLLL